MQNDNGYPMLLKSPDGKSRVPLQVPLSPLLNLFTPWNLTKCVWGQSSNEKAQEKSSIIQSQQTHVHMQDILSTTHITHQVEGKWDQQNEGILLPLKHIWRSFAFPFINVSFSLTPGNSHHTWSFCLFGAFILLLQKNREELMDLWLNVTVRYWLAENVPENHMYESVLSARYLHSIIFLWALHPHSTSLERVFLFSIRDSLLKARLRGSGKPNSSLWIQIWSHYPGMTNKEYHMLLATDDQGAVTRPGQWKLVNISIRILLIGCHPKTAGHEREDYPVANAHLKNEDSTKENIRTRQH